MRLRVALKVIYVKLSQASCHACLIAKPHSQYMDAEHMFSAESLHQGRRNTSFHSTMQYRPLSQRLK